MLQFNTGSIEYAMSFMPEFKFLFCLNLFLFHLVCRSRGKKGNWCDNINPSVILSYFCHFVILLCFHTDTDHLSFIPCVKAGAPAKPQQRHIFSAFCLSISKIIQMTLVEVLGHGKGKVCVCVRACVSDKTGCSCENVPLSFWGHFKNEY